MFGGCGSILLHDAVGELIDGVAQLFQVFPLRGARPTAQEMVDAMQRFGATVRSAGEVPVQVPAVLPEGVDQGGEQGVHGRISADPSNCAASPDTIAGVALRRGKDAPMRGRSTPPREVMDLGPSGPIR